MTATTYDTSDRAASTSLTRIRVGGAWLAIAALAFIASLLLHARPSPDPNEFMANIAAAPTQWVVAHWIAAISSALFVIVGLIILTAESRLTDKWWTVTAWAVLVVGSIWITSTALIEATVVSVAAVEGDTATFVEWQRYGQALALAFVAVAPALATIAFNEARNGPETTPVWASWIGAVAGIVAGLAFFLLVAIEIPMAGVVWIPTTILTALWVLWFGISLARSDGISKTVTQTSETVG